MSGCKPDATQLFLLSFAPIYAPRRSASALDQPAKKFTPSPAWDTEDSLDLYQVTAWGKPYFGINEAGHVVVRADGTPERDIDLFEVVEGLKARDLTTPVVVRFSDILTTA